MEGQLQKKGCSGQAIENANEKLVILVHAIENEEEKLGKEKKTSNIRWEVMHMKKTAILDGRSCPKKMLYWPCYRE